MARFFPEELYVGDSLERTFQVKINGTPKDISGEQWELLVKDHAYQSDDDSYYQTTAMAYGTGFTDGLAMFHIPPSVTEAMTPRGYHFVIRSTDTSGSVDTSRTVVSERVRMIRK